MAVAKFVQAAPKTIYQQGTYVEYVQTKGKNKGKVSIKIDRTVPEDENDEPLINQGESYYWWTLPYSRKRYSKTRPKDSELTSSEYFSQVYEFAERVEEMIVESPEELKEFVEELKMDVESLKADTESNLERIPENLQYGPTAVKLEERIDSLDEAIDKLDDIDCDYTYPTAQMEAGGNFDKMKQWLDERILQLKTISFG